MSTAQAHDYGSMPFGAHDAKKAAKKPKPAKPEKEQDDMAAKRASAIARLQRAEIGATPAQAEAVVDHIGVDVITAESDAALKDKLAAALADTYDPADHTVKDVKAYVGDDAVKAQQVLEAEQARGEYARPSLVSHLEKLSASSEEPHGEGGDADEAETNGDGDDADEDANSDG